MEAYPCDTPNAEVPPHLRIFSALERSDQVGTNGLVWPQRDPSSHDAPQGVIAIDHILGRPHEGNLLAAQFHHLVQRLALLAARAALI